MSLMKKKTKLTFKQNISLFHYNINHIFFMKESFCFVHHGVLPNKKKNKPHFHNAPEVFLYYLVSMFYNCKLM